MASDSDDDLLADLQRRLDERAPPRRPTASVAAVSVASLTNDEFDAALDALVMDIKHAVESQGKSEVVVGKNKVRLGPDTDFLAWAKAQNELAVQSLSIAGQNAVHERVRAEEASNYASWSLSANVVGAAVDRQPVNLFMSSTPLKSAGAVNRTQTNHHREHQELEVTELSPINAALDDAPGETGERPRILVVTETDSDASRPDSSIPAAEAEKARKNAASRGRRDTQVLSELPPFVASKTMNVVGGGDGVKAAAHASSKAMSTVIRDRRTFAIAPGAAASVNVPAVCNLDETIAISSGDKVGSDEQLNNTMVYPNGMPSQRVQPFGLQKSMSQCESLVDVNDGSIYSSQSSLSSINNNNNFTSVIPHINNRFALPTSVAPQIVKRGVPAGLRQQQYFAEQPPANGRSEHVVFAKNAGNTVLNNLGSSDSLDSVSNNAAPTTPRSNLTQQRHQVPVSSSSSSSYLPHPGVINHPLSMSGLRAPGTMLRPPGGIRLPSSVLYR